MASYFSYPAWDEEHPQASLEESEKRKEKKTKEKKRNEEKKKSRRKEEEVMKKIIQMKIKIKIMKKNKG